MIDPMTIGAIAGGVGSLIGATKKSAAEKAYEAMIEELESIGVPSEQAQQYAFERLQSQGILTPEMEADILAGPSKMAEVSVDPRLAEAQRQALQRMQQVGMEGLTAEDKLALSQAAQEAGRSERGRQEAILQNMAARGISGSGMELASRLSSAQEAAERQSMEDQRIAALAAQRRLQGISQAGTMAGGMREQEFGEASKRAEAADILERFNVANRIGTQQRNVGARNTAAERNLAEKQRIADTNVRIGHEEERRRKDLPMEHYRARMEKAGLIGGNQVKLGQTGRERIGQGFEGTAKVLESAPGAIKSWQDLFNG
jgi:hypothetical protein